MMMRSNQYQAQLHYCHVQIIKHLVSITKTNMNVARALEHDKTSFLARNGTPEAAHLAVMCCGVSLTLVCAL